MFKQQAYFTALILTFGLMGCKKDSADKIGPCYHTAEIEENYLEDAHRLMFREIYRDSITHPNFHQVYFDSTRAIEILDALQAIHDLNVPESDSVFDVHKIHTFPYLGLRTISMKTDTSAIEVKRLINGLPTGNILLDSIIQKFQFDSVRTSYSYPDFNWISITSRKDLNLFPIIEDLRQLPFFYVVGFGGGAIGDGADIDLTRKAGAWVFDFNIGWGDCPAGCINHRHWIFEVDDHCHARFIRSYQN